MASKLENLNVRFNRADHTVTLSNGVNSLEIQLLDAADVAHLQSIAERICAEKRRKRARAQRTR